MWVRPCQCRGSTAFAHQQCLRLWIQSKRDGDFNMVISCPSCKTPYRIRQPPTPGYVQVAHSFADLWALLPKLLAGVAVVYAAWTLLDVYGQWALHTILGEGFEKLETSTAFWEPEWTLSTYSRSFSIFLICMLFSPSDVIALFACVVFYSALPGLYAIFTVLLVAMDVPGLVYRQIISPIYRTIYPRAQTLQIQTLEDIAANQEEDTYLRRLARTIAFPNARVHASKSSISCISFVLKIFLLDHNVEQLLPSNALPPPPRRNHGDGQKQRTLFVEYERGNILIAALRARLFRIRTAVPPRQASPSAEGPRRRRVRRRVRAEDEDVRPTSPIPMEPLPAHVDTTPPRPRRPSTDRSISPPNMSPEDLAAAEEYKVIMFRRIAQLSEPRLPPFDPSPTPAFRSSSPSHSPPNQSSPLVQPEPLALRKVSSFSDLRQPEPARPRPQPPLPRETFLTIDIATVKAHMYYLVSHTLLLPFILRVVADWVVVPIVYVSMPWFTSSSLISVTLTALGRHALDHVGTRVALAGLGYGVGRELAVRWWRGRIQRQMSDIHVEDFEQ
jgi:hypothetical protein